MTAPSKRDPRRLIRLGLQLLCASLLAFATFVAASHGLLWWALAGTSAGDLRVSYQRVVSLTPGTLRLRAVRITRPAEWSLTIESVDARLAWSSLLRAEPVFRWVRVRGARLKLEARSGMGAGQRAAGPTEAATLRFAGASAARALTTPRWTVEQLNMQIEVIEDRERRVILADGALLSAHGIQGSRSGLVAARAHLSLQRARVTHEQRSLATLAGDVHAKHARIWLRGSLAISASSRWQIEARLASDPPATVALRGPLRLEQGRPAAPTHLTVTLQQLWLWQQGGFRAELAAGSELDIVAAADGRVTGRAELPGLRLGSPGRWPLVLRSVVIERIWLRNLLRTLPGPVALRMRAERAMLETSAWPESIESPVLARLTLLKQSDATWTLGNSSVEFASAKLVGDARASADRARLRFLIDNATLEAGPAFGLEGRIELSAPSLRSVLPAFQVPQRLQWLLGPFLRQPLDARAHLSRTERALWLRDLRMQAGKLKVAGHVEQSGQTRRGALLLTSPLTSVGLRFDGESHAAVLRPPAGWLEEQAIGSP